MKDLIRSCSVGNTDTETMISEMNYAPRRRSVNK